MLFDPALDLELTRLFAAPPAKVWRCWTDPALFCQWWTPKPVITRDVVLDLRSGGRFFTVMVMPDGSEMASEGAFLEVIPGHKVAFTDLFQADWKPAAEVGLGFAGIITMAAEGSGTRYTARARHRSVADQKTHADMGFDGGWGTAAAQLDALAASL